MDFQHIIESAGGLMDFAGVAVMVLGALVSIPMALRGFQPRRLPAGSAPLSFYRSYRQLLGRSILLGLELLVATYGAVGLGENKRDLMTGGDDGFEGRDGELRGSAEDEFHSPSMLSACQEVDGEDYHSPFLISFLILRTRRSFLRRLRRSIKRTPSRWSISC